jgi:hypothetical protein
MSDRRTTRRIDELISDTEDAKEELASLFGIQAILSEEAEACREQKKRKTKAVTTKRHRSHTKNPTSTKKQQRTTSHPATTRQ